MHFSVRFLQQWGIQNLHTVLENLWKSACSLQGMLRWAFIRLSYGISSVERQLQTIVVEGGNKVQVPGHQLFHPKPPPDMARHQEEVSIAIKTPALFEIMLPTPGLIYPSAAAC